VKKQKDVHLILPVELAMFGRVLAAAEGISFPEWIRRAMWNAAEQETRERNRTKLVEHPGPGAGGGGEDLAHSEDAGDDQRGEGVRDLEGGPDPDVQGGGPTPSPGT
jgi:hypothetical protein